MQRFPADSLGNIDWVSALSQGLIKPRHAIQGTKAPEIQSFGFDFMLPGPDPDYDAYFPHSIHTQWLTCASFRAPGSSLRQFRCSNSPADSPEPLQ